MKIDKEQLTEYLRQIGRKGGKARAKVLGPERRRAIGKRAAQARWSKRKRGGHEQA